MKRIIVCIYLLFVTSISNAQTPELYSTLPTGGTARDLTLKGLDTGYCINGYYLHRSIDKLKTWTNSKSLQFGGAYTFTALDIFENNIMAGLNSGGRYYLSNNGGDTWTDVKFIGKNAQINDIEYLSSSTVYALTGSASVIDSIILFRSTDGAETWERIYKFPKRGTDAKMTFLNSNIAAVYFDENLYITKDAGQNWFTPSGLDTLENILSVFLYDAQHAFVGQDLGGLYKSNDGYNKFSFQSSASPKIDYENQIHFIDLNTGYLTEGYTRDFQFRKTTDGGLNWVVLANGVNFKKFHLNNDNTAFLYGANNNIYKVNTIASNVEKQYIDLNFKIYPNPSENKFNIEFPYTHIGSTIEIYNSTGIKVFEKKINSVKEYFEINTAGLYLIKVDQHLIGRVNIN